MKINEIFLSVQGEGISLGLPTIFIRTTGCNLRCEWCDTKYAYHKGKEMKVSQILQRCKKFGFKRVCITGGEPLLQKKELVILTKLLIKNKFEIQIQTNGSLDIKGLPAESIIALDMKCPSSKMNDKMRYENLKLIKEKDAVIFIIGDKKDYQFAKKIIKKYKLERKTNVLLQPVYQNKKFTQTLIKNILKDRLRVRFGLQLHKIIWGANKKGV